ncbi:hypothetical protein BKA64DRAFT_274608 [Cadophora sp. MPI-SDFR-AT-0126]|nr:hypothetical protein BKA64DRAFT_274608 [Leotiomycetes sp. MPI-SDFR-AT-0126]
MSNLPWLTVEETQCQDTLVSLIVGDDLVKGSLLRASSWYTSFLRSKFTSIWHLLVQTLVGLDATTTSPRSGDLVIVYDFFIRIVQLMRAKENLALVEIVDELDSNGTLKRQLDQERAIPNQVVFAAIGWLTMFYDPVSHPRVDKLEVAKTSTNSSGGRNALATRKYLTFRQGFDYIDLPIYSMLGRFGDLLPTSRPALLCTEQDLASCPTRDSIIVQNVCFNTLHGLAELNIEWVTSLTLHLELDSSKKSIKLFQYPSYCRMMAAQKNGHILSRILNDHATNSCEDVSVPQFPTAEYFEEILLSYRLIFGQDNRSWKAFSRMIATKEDSAMSGVASWACDPLIYELCAKRCSSDEASVIYDEIDANEPIEHYNPHIEFPFFGKRLLELQQYVQVYQPTNVRSLLSDRRNVAAWYNLWNNQILVLFATLTIFLMVVSLIFQVWQVVLDLKSPNQSFPPVG